MLKMLINCPTFQTLIQIFPEVQIALRTYQPFHVTPCFLGSKGPVSVRQRRSFTAGELLAPRGDSGGRPFLR